MTGFLDHIDQTLFLFLNGINNPFFDRVIFGATKGLIYVPLYLYFLLFVIRKYKWNTLWILVFATLMILASDQLSNLVKDSVQRLRPSRQPGLVVHIVEAYKGGTFGFYSAHATNTFCVVVFLIVTLGKKYWYVILPAVCWSLLMSYSRIYLGVHYPGDILAGWIAGGLIGYLFGMGVRKTMEVMRKEKPKNQVDS
ncbi:MAG: phosphatase PAP2 family protein [Bacteroidetes bacterium]|nr:phosphatase PAP2 family protein [Bacteroidota bacterium]